MHRPRRKKARLTFFERQFSLGILEVLGTFAGQDIDKFIERVTVIIWLLAGGIIYTIGGLIYALKLPIFNNKHKNFGSHEIFNLFVMGGSLCHFILMFSLL